MTDDAAYVYRHEGSDPLPVWALAQIAEEDLVYWFYGLWRKKMVSLVSEKAMLATLGRVGFACWMGN